MSESKLAHRHPDKCLNHDSPAMLESFTTSVKGNLFEVEYTLRAYVKHEAWNDFGEGNCVMLPIKIY